MVIPPIQFIIDIIEDLIYIVILSANYFRANYVYYTIIILKIQLIEHFLIKTKKTGG